jgi:quinol monooxygenase YgiN
MIEVYRDDEAVKVHRENAKHKDFGPTVDDLVVDRRVDLLHMVSDGQSKR